MRTFSLDLRQRVLSAALDGAASEQAVADRFGVSRAFVQKIKRRWRAHGTAAPVDQRRGPRPLLSNDDRVALAAWVGGSPDATVEELRRRLADERAVTASEPTVRRALAALGLSYKKRNSAPTSASATT